MRRKSRPHGPFNAAYYLGSEEHGTPPRFTATEFEIIRTATQGLLLALSRPDHEYKIAARALATDSRRRFHSRRK
jgi:hypothetical protein